MSPAFAAGLVIGGTVAICVAIIGLALARAAGRPTPLPPGLVMRGGIVMLDDSKEARR